MANEIIGRLENEKVSRLLLQYAIPAVIGTMVNALYNIVDRVFIGQGVGALAIAGLTLTFPILLFLQAFGMLVGAGAATRVSIHLGRKANEMAEKVLGNAFTLTFIITIITVVPCMIWMEDLLQAFGGSEQTIPYAKDYLNIVVPGTILTSLSFGFNAIMRASGYPKKAMFTMLIGAIANVVLDPIFIFGLHLDVRGAALATILSQGISCIWILHFLTGTHSTLRIRLRNLRPQKKFILPCLALGLAPFIMQFTESALSISFNTSLLKYGGDTAVGAMTILSSVMQFSMLPLQGLTQGAQPIISFNYGAKNIDRVKKAFHLLLRSAACYSTLLWLLCMLVPQIFISIFTSDADLASYTIWALRIYMAASLLFAVQLACQQTFIALGNAKTSVFLALLRKVLLLIPLIFILPHFVSNPVFGVFVAEPVADTIAVATTAALFFREYKKLG